MPPALCCLPQDLHFHPCRWDHPLLNMKRILAAIMVTGLLAGMADATPARSLAKRRVEKKRDAQETTAVTQAQAPPAAQAPAASAPATTGTPSSNNAGSAPAPAPAAQPSILLTRAHGLVPRQGQGCKGSRCRVHCRDATHREAETHLPPHVGPKSSPATPLTGTGTSPFLTFSSCPPPGKPGDLALVSARHRPRH
jgi:hypothetical protein